MSNEIETPEPLISRSTVQLYLNSINGPIARLLQERVSIRLGRQVKTAQEKTSQSPNGQEQNEEPPTSPDHENQRVRSDSTPATPSFNNSPQTKSSAVQETHVWFKSKVVSRSHAEIWLKDGQVYLRDVGSSSGTFLNNLRLSPANKMSRPYPLRQGDIIKLGVDYQGRTEGNFDQPELYRAVELQVQIEINDAHTRLQKEIPKRFRRALNLLMTASNPAAIEKETDIYDLAVDCCICISELGPFQAIFMAPCSHCFHYKCIHHILRENIMFPCPVCRQVANLEASVSMESVIEDKKQNWRKPLERSRSSILFSESEMDTQNQFAFQRPQFGLDLTTHHASRDRPMPPPRNTQGTADGEMDTN